MKNAREFSASSLHLDHNLGTPLYIQLYEALRDGILHGAITGGERLPSLRSASSVLGISMTTVKAAYDQLVVEGYILNRPKSGYFAARLDSSEAAQRVQEEDPETFSRETDEPPKYRFDLDAFDFVKWKKCMSAVLNEHPQLLLSEGDRQGERVLRYEIAQYVRRFRGVQCTPDQIVVGAGTQQLTNHLARILRRMDIRLICTEDPGYLPVQNIFHDRGFGIERIPVGPDGIRIERLPENVPSAVYVIPSNQFPTGAVMPVGRRYELIRWAARNGSVVLEDDYDSELRYIGRPVPALSSLDENARLVYLGSFSSTLFSAIRISYMVLPAEMAEIFAEIRDGYDQTSSKTEQLTLALYMQRGWYQTHIKKLRALYAQKLHTVLQVFRRCAPDFIAPVNTDSGIHILLRVRSDRSPDELARRAETCRLRVVPLTDYTNPDSQDPELIFYYNQIPLGDIDAAVRAMIRAWKR